ncbi:hypothetical protein BSPWISOXPB_10262 [uncultured Gammaproteobacteria bacterium]|nr:hypothetical protein BSPWISOXPB_10262 [uncultured Gammaproteobacteria bacterium]
MTKPKPLVMSTTTLMAAPPFIAGKDKTEVQQKRYRYTTKKEMIIVVYITMAPDT